MQDFRYILILFSLALMMACQSPQQVEDRLVTAFEETMFGQRGPAHDRQGSDGSEAILSKWRSPVEVSIVEGATDSNTTLVRKELERFAALSGLEIRLLPPENKAAPLTLFFSDRKDFVINGNQMASCYTHIEDGDDGAIAKAEVYIALVEEGVWREDCLVHELLHAFGWRGHTHSIRSAISYMHGESDLTRWDEHLMRTLYDPRLEPGKQKADALPAARAILHEILVEK